MIKALALNALALFLLFTLTPVIVGFFYVLLT